jgi:hypothetical protein
MRVEGRDGGELNVPSWECGRVHIQ